MIKVPEELVSLAKIFKDNNFTLYLVGGYVRDSIMGLTKISGEDYDICSSAKPSEIEKIFEKNKDFILSPLSKELGVLKIVGEKNYEHATFRKEYYTDDSHIPAKVEFIKSLSQDAERRDFKINAIYYDILEDKIIDPLGGEEDIKNKIITTTKDPRLVFGDDPERILRLIRFSCSLGFNVGEKELEFSKKFAGNVVYISRGRIRKEFEKMLYCDKIYKDFENGKFAHITAINLLEDYKLLEPIFPLLHESNVSNKFNYHGKKYFEYILNHIKKAKPNIRLAVIFFDFVEFKKPKDKNEKFDKSAYLKQIVEENIGEKITNFPTERKENIIKTVLGYDFYEPLLFKTRKTRRFIYDNYSALNEILEIKSFIKLPPKEDKKRIQSIDAIKQTLKIMKDENVIFDKYKLKITGKELIREFPKVKLELLDEFTDQIAGKMAEQKTENNRENIIKIGNKVINSKRDYWLDK